MNRHFDLSFLFAFAYIPYQDGRVVKALDLSSNGRVVRVGSNPTPGKALFFSPTLHLTSQLVRTIKPFRATSSLLPFYVKQLNVDKWAK